MKYIFSTRRNKVKSLGWLPLTLLFILVTSTLAACGTTLNTPDSNNPVNTPTPNTPPPVATVTSTVTPPVPVGTIAPSSTALPATTTPKPTTDTSLPTVTPSNQDNGATPTTGTAPLPSPTTQSETVQHNHWEQVGLAGVYVRGLYGVTSDGHTFYAASPKGLEKGTLDSTNQVSWTAIRNDDIGPFAVREPNEIWYTSPGSCAKGQFVGLWHSTDGGANWSRSNQDRIFNSLTFANDTLYASTCDGAIKSSDGGKSWKKIIQPKTINGDLANIQISPADSKIIVLTYLTEGGTSFIMRSTDAGKNWTDISVKEETPGLATGLNAFPGSLASDVYALGMNGFWASSDGGSSWHHSLKGLDKAKLGSAGGYLMNSFTPNNDDSILFLGTGALQIKGAGVFVSKDNGANWSALGDNPLDGYTVSDFAFMPNGALYVATNDGVYRIYP